MQNFSMKLGSWNVDGGFGFGAHGQDRYFVHNSVITPRPKRGADLRGQEIVVLETGRGDKGLHVEKAVTVMEWQRLEAVRLADEKKAGDDKQKVAAEKARFEADPGAAWTWLESNKKSWWRQGEQVQVEGFQFLFAYPAGLIELEKVELAVDLVIRLRRKVRMFIETEAGHSEELESHEFTRELSPDEAWQFVDGCLATAVVNDGMVQLEWAGRYNSTKFSFGLTAPATFDEPEILTEGWCQRPYGIMQRTSVSLNGRELWWRQPAIWPPAKAHAELGGEFDLQPLIDQIQNWSPRATFEELTHDTKIHFAVGLATRTETTTTYFDDDYLGRDDWFGSGSSTEKYEVSYPAIKVTFRSGLLAGRSNFEDGQIGWAWSLSVEQDPARFCRATVEEWLRGRVVECVREFGFPETEEVKALADGFLQSLLAQIPPFAMASDLWHVSPDTPALDALPVGAVRFEKNFGMVLPRDYAEEQGVPGHVLSGGEQLVWWLGGSRPQIGGERVFTEKTRTATRYWGDFAEGEVFEAEVVRRGNVPEAECQQGYWYEVTVQVQAPVITTRTYGNGEVVEETRSYVTQTVTAKNHYICGPGPAQGKCRIRCSVIQKGKSKGLKDYEFVQ